MKLLHHAPSAAGIAQAVETIRDNEAENVVISVNQAFGVIAVDGNWLVVNLRQPDPAQGRPLLAAWHGRADVPAGTIGLELAAVAGRYA